MVQPGWTQALDTTSCVWKGNSAGLSLTTADSLASALAMRAGFL